MPELADVEGWKRYVARYAEGQRVVEVHVPTPQIVRNTSPQGLGRALAGGRLGPPRRHGKWLDIPTGKGHLLLHFGMTGGLSWTTHAGRLERFVRAILVLEEGELHYYAQRMFGGLWWVPEKQSLVEFTGPLGPDAATIERDDFAERLAQRRGNLKAALMDQELLAGLGNELSDEILWNARLSPQLRTQDLSARDRDRLFQALKEVLRLSIRHGRIPHKSQWLNSVRGNPHAPCPRCGTPVEVEKLSGRSAYWCPRCQRSQPSESQQVGVR